MKVQIRAYGGRTVEVDYVCWLAGQHKVTTEHATIRASMAYIETRLDPTMTLADARAEAYQAIGDLEAFAVDGELDALNYALEAEWQDFQGSQIHGPGAIGLGPTGVGGAWWRWVGPWATQSAAV